MERLIDDHQRDPKPHPRMGLTDLQRSQIAALLVALGSGPVLGNGLPTTVRTGVSPAAGSGAEAARADHQHALDLPDNLDALAGLAGAGLITRNPDGSYNCAPLAAILQAIVDAPNAVGSLTNDGAGNLTWTPSAAAMARQYAWSVAS